MNPAPCLAALLRVQVLGIIAFVACSTLLFASPASAASLAEALDNPSLEWRTSSETPWVSQTTESHDGVDAAQSASITNNESCWIETTVTGPAPLSFWWKVSSELGWDRLEFLIDGVEMINISGENVPWEMRAFDIEPGSHVLQWRYKKDPSVNEGQDRAWLDQVSYTPPEPFAPVIFEGPVDHTVAAGASVTFSVAAAALPSPSYQWFHNGASIPGATNSLLILNNVTLSHAGAYTVLVRNSLGSTNSSPGILIVTIVGEAVEAPELDWTLGGDSAWFGQSVMTHDGEDALESGATANQQESWVETTVTGPGVLTFWWKTSSEAFYDGLQFLTNNGVAASLSGEAIWAKITNTFSAGTFTLRWRYTNDSNIIVGQNKGWLDEVTFIPNKAPINLVVTLNRQAIFENESITLNASFADPDATDPHTLLINWRDGSSITTNLAPGVLAFSAAHQYKDDDPTASQSDSYQITVSVSDEAGTVTGIYPITVSNALPRLSNLSLSSLIFPYDTAVVSGTLSDLGTLDPLKLRIHWGDSTNVESFDYPPGGSSFLFRHRYSVVNSNAQVTLTATDDDLGVTILRTNVIIRPFPARARVVSVSKGTDANSVIKLHGTAQANYQIQSSVDLVHWTTIAIRTASAGGLFEVEEPGGFAFSRRFYRAIWESQSAGMRFSAISKRSNGQMGIQLIGVPGAGYRIDGSTNFLNWTTITSAIMDSNGVFNFTDPASGGSRKFYRAIIP